MSLSKRNKALYISIFDFLFLIIAGITVEYITKGLKEPPNIYLWLSSILVLLVILSSIIFKESLCATNYNSYLVLATFALSVVFMVLTKDRPELPIWLICPIISAALVDSGIGLFLGYFVMLQLVNLAETDLVVYFVHVLCLLIVCQMIKRAYEFRHIIYIDTAVTCVNLLVYIMGKAHRLSALSEDTIISIICTYLLFVTSIGTMRIAMKKSKNKIKKNTAMAVESAANNTGFDYLNEMASDLDRMESLGNVQVPTLEDILDAEINDLKVATVEPITDYQAPAGLSPVREADIDYAEFVSLHMELLNELKEKNKQNYIQSKRVAALASECAKVINANHAFTNAIGLFYQAHDHYEEFPEKLKAAIMEVNAVTESSQEDTEAVYITSKEAALVFLTIKISTIFFYMKAKNNASLAPKKLVDSTMGTEVFGGKLNNSGLSIKECSEIREYFVEKLSSLL